MSPRSPGIRHEQTLGFRVWRVQPHAAMPAAHTHPDIELNFLSEGSLTYLQGGTRRFVGARQLALFWGGSPHQSLAPGISGRGIWMTLPLVWVLQWQLPNKLSDRLLKNEFLIVDAEEAQLERWLADYQSGDPARRRALLLEVEAWLVRVALTQVSRPRETRRNAEGAGQIERITAYVAAHYQETMRVDDIARAMGLHPKYLMKVFKKNCRIGVWEYLTRLRVAHAQRLLVMTEERVTDIALESGFGSPASFYQAFARFAAGEKPVDYRRRHERKG